MKHLAIRARSLLNLNKPYTTPGLGDRIHTIYFSYLYAVANNTPVTIHLDSWKYGKPHKLASWKEVLELFPKDIVNIQYHEIITPTDQQWLDFLKQKGIDAEYYHYTDYFHRDDKIKSNIELNKYLSDPILLTSNTNRSKVITTQWLSTDRNRSISPLIASKVEQNYIENGYQIINLDNSKDIPLNKIAEIMSNASYHFGVDSGMYHMALLYHKFNSIHLYSTVNGIPSHHYNRAVRNGVKCIKV